MDPQPWDKVPYLKRLAGKVASCLATHRSWVWRFLGICLLAAVASVICQGTSPAVKLQHARVAASVARVSQSVSAPPRNLQRITFDQPQDATVGQPVALTASSMTTTSPPVPTGLPVSFRSDTPAMCSVSGVTATATVPGFCVITASQAGDGTRTPAPDVARAFWAHAGSEPQTITFDQPTVGAVGQPVALTASSMTTASPPVPTGLPVSLRSDTPDVCTVSGPIVIPTTADVCTITASQGGSDRYAAAQNVQHSFQAHTGSSDQTITFTPPSGAEVGQQVTLTATATSGLTVSFRSDTPLMCTVSGSTVTTVVAGTCTITAFQGGNSTFAAVQDEPKSFQVSAGGGRQAIVFSPVAGATVGVPVVLSASSVTYDPRQASTPPVATGLTVSFLSQTRRVCTVSGSTLVPWTAGECRIIAFQGGSAKFQPAAAAQKFPVEPASQTISFTPPTGATIDQQVTLTATASSNLPVTFSSNSPDVCTVTGSTVTPTAAGTCAIAASQPGNDQFAPATPVKKSFPVARIAQTIDFPQPPDIAFGKPLTLTATASSGLAVSYGSTTPDVCTVSGSAVTTTTAGTCSITATQAGNDRFAPARGVVRSFQVQAGHHVQTITFPEPPAAKVGVPVALSASASSGLAVSFRSDTPRVCTVSGATVTTTAAGTCTITASQGGSGRYVAARDVGQSFRVDPAASIVPGALVFFLGGLVLAAAGVTALVRRVRLRSRRPPAPQPSVRAVPDPGPPGLVSVQNTGAGVTHTVRIESDSGASITTIKEARP